MSVLLYSFIGVVIIILIYQLVFYWVFKEPINITGSIKRVAPATDSLAGKKEVSFKINNRVNKTFAIEKIILKIEDQYHPIDNYKIVSYPLKVKGFETFILKLPIEFLQQLVEKDFKDWNKMLVKISITIRGNNASYRSNQIRFL